MHGILNDITAACAEATGYDQLYFDYFHFLIFLSIQARHAIACPSLDVGFFVPRADLCPREEIRCILYFPTARIVLTHCILHLLTSSTFYFCYRTRHYIEIDIQPLNPERTRRSIQQDASK